MGLVRACILACITGILVLERIADAGYCYRPYKCSSRNQRLTSYTTSCGFMNLARCKKYRNVQHTTYRNCYSKYCCPGSSCLQRNDSGPSVFKTYNISRRLLPRGCAYITLESCRGVETGSKIMLASTSPWYQLKNNQNTLYTFGVIFADIDDFSIPVSMTGMTVRLARSDFKLITGSSGYRRNDGIKQNHYYDKDCSLFEITDKDRQDFVASGSFYGSMFYGLNDKLPTWLQLSKSDTGIDSVVDMKTELVIGSKLDSIDGCRGAPVYNDRLYSIFLFGADFSFNIYGKRFNVPSANAGNKFCIIIDICQNNGGTVFIMLPPESRSLLNNIDIFTTTLRGFRIRPEGIGISLSKDIVVDYKTSEMTLWNGDQMFQYPVFPRGSMWFGREIEYNLEFEHFSLQVKGETDIFLSVSSLSSLPLDMFIEEWSSVLKLKRLNFQPTIKFPLFGKTVQVTFNVAAIGSLDIYLSGGGIEERTWCGDGSNPPGLFVAFVLEEIHPFKDIPIIGEWNLIPKDAGSQIYGFIIKEEQSSFHRDIDVVNEIKELKDISQRFIVLLGNIMLDFDDVLASTIKERMSYLSDALKSLTIYLGNVIGDSNVKNVLTICRNVWKIFSNNIQRSVTHVTDILEFESNTIAKNLTNILETEVNKIGLRIESLMSQIRTQIMSLPNQITGFGFRFYAFVKLDSLEFAAMEIEIVQSIDKLGQCNKYKKFYEIMNEKEALKVLAGVEIPIQLGPYFKFEKGALSIAMSLKTDKFVAHAHVQGKILGLINTYGDLLISNSGIFISIEGNIWNLFFAKLELSTKLGKKWHDITYNIKGAFSNGDFESRYTNEIQRFAQHIAEEANNRLQAAQNRLTAAQNMLTNGQRKLTSAISYLRSCESKFTNAMNGLQYAKNKLEKAKAPYEKALAKLRQAQRNVNNLCKIKTCNRICVPGMKWSKCKGAWGITFPCLKWTNCMFKIPDVLCEAANAACRTIRYLAYAALEAAKIIVKTSIVAFDLAKTAMSVAQVVVDKSRIVLVAAEKILEVTKAGLEVVKHGLEIAKRGLDLVKSVVRAALHVFNLLVSGLQNKLIDVRNCGFSVQISTYDRSFFNVSCDVQAFFLGWKTFQFEFDFKHPTASMLRIAKATMTNLLDSINNILGKRRKRDISFLSASKLYHILHRYKRENVNDTIHSEFLKTLVFEADTSNASKAQTSYEDRMLLFKRNCDSFHDTHSFLIESIDALLDMCKETVSILAAQYKTTIPMNVNLPLDNMTAESLGISREYALHDYNITSEDLDDVIHDFKLSIHDDPMIEELDNSSKQAEDEIELRKNEANAIQISEYWISGMENQTENHFEESECSNFEDCILYAFSNLYDLFSDDSLRNADLNRNLTSSIENKFLLLVLNSSIKVTSVYEIASSIKQDLTQLNTSHEFCSTAPIITTVLSNKSVLVQSNIEMHCDATGNPIPHIKWYHNDEVLVGKNGSILQLTNVSKQHEGSYRCTAENVVADISSEEAFVSIKECEPGTYFNLRSCTKCSKGQYQQGWNTRTCHECPIGYTTTELGSKSDADCYDIDECREGISGCDHVCVNTNGSFICECTSGFTLKSDKKSCSGANNLIVPIAAGIGSGIVVIMSVVLFLHVRSKYLNNRKGRSSEAATKESSLDPICLNEKLDRASKSRPNIYSTM